MPCATAIGTACRHPGSASRVRGPMPESRSKFGKSLSRSKAFMIGSSNRARMIHSPFQDAHDLAQVNLPLVLGRGDAQQCHPLREGADHRCRQGLADTGYRPTVLPEAPAGLTLWSCPLACTRSAFILERTRASMAALMVGIGTPRQTDLIDRSASTVAIPLPLSGSTTRSRAEKATHYRHTHFSIRVHSGKVTRKGVRFLWRDCGSRVQSIDFSRRREPQPCASMQPQALASSASPCGERTSGASRANQPRPPANSGSWLCRRSRCRAWEGAARRTVSANPDQTHVTSRQTPKPLVGLTGRIGRPRPTPSPPSGSSPTLRPSVPPRRARRAQMPTPQPRRSHPGADQKRGSQSRWPVPSGAVPSRRPAR